MGELLLDCSGWNYGDTPDKGDWVGIFYPDKNTKTQILFPILQHSRNERNTFERAHKHPVK
jgi:hypothetical protein